ncbi:MAG: hypothetical protein M1521_02970 [Thermotogae bacterium]|jgi:hypothetical protein|nr:hypothetical protein [Thermotogota bacterium]
MKKLQIIALVIVIVLIVAFSFGIYIHYVGISITKGETPKLNSAGLFTRGDYVSIHLNVPSIAQSVKIIVWSKHVPPNNFDIYLMTPDQYHSFVNGDKISLFKYQTEWDLTRYWSFSKNEYYIDEKISIAGSYYIVISNNYMNPFGELYGNAHFQILVFPF